MGVRLGPSFPNALPLAEARQDPRRGLLYRTIVRSPLVPPEAILRASRYGRQALGQYGDENPDENDDNNGDLTVAQMRRRSVTEPVLTRPTISVSQAFPQNYSAPGGGIRIERPRVRVEIDTQESTQAKIERWLEEESVFAGIKNKWLAIAGAILVWKKL